MNRHDWLIVGLKLLGVYFAVLGVTILSMAVLNLLIQGIEAATSTRTDPTYLAVHVGRSIDLISALQPVAYLACAFVLVRRTDWCLRKMDLKVEGSVPSEGRNTSGL